MTEKKENQRSMRYSARSKADAIAWQKAVRSHLARLLRIEDLQSSKHETGLNPRAVSTKKKDGYTLKEIEINSTPGRRMKLVVTTPRSPGDRFPAVVCIHGHEGSRHIVYEDSAEYRGFARCLAETGYATISTDVGQHEIYEENRLLMGERLWDLMRCVDYLESLESVDTDSIGCAGLSLGGEMAMWLGAMDMRIDASVSAGFLTTMDQMEQNHCMCWKFPGLRDLVDYADIYSLHAPRPLMCQNGLKEPPILFPVSIALEALSEIHLIYSDLGSPENVTLLAHGEGHAVNLSSLLAFFGFHLQCKG